MDTQTKTTTCTYCQVTYTGRGWDHECRTADLPRATRRDGKYAMRRIEGEGFVMFVDVPDTKANREFEIGGTSYVVGHVMDPENFHAAVYEAQEEARILIEQAREEFGF